jgi:hypothetical protein
MEPEKLMDPDDMGADEGKQRGPEPGKGGVVHHSSGEADFDGLAGDELPPRKNAAKGLSYPPEKAED